MNQIVILSATSKRQQIPIKRQRTRGLRAVLILEVPFKNTQKRLKNKKPLVTGS